MAEAAGRFGPDVLYAPVIAQETGGKNKIPHALARFTPWKSARVSANNQRKPISSITQALRERLPAPPKPRR